MNEQTEHEQHLQDIAELERDCGRAEAAYEESKAKTSELKKALDAKLIAMRKYVRDLSAPLPLFEQWRMVRLSEFLTEGIAAMLTESGIETVGQLADYTAAGKRLVDLAGIGAAKAEYIERQLEEFWAKRNREPGKPDIEPLGGVEEEH